MVQQASNQSATSVAGRSPSTSANSVWMPTPEVCRHSGGRIPGDLEFFAVPPPAIGRVISADSTLKIDSKPPSRLSRFLQAGIGSFLTAGVACVLLTIYSFPFTFLIFLFWFYKAFGFSHDCTYVGAHGIAKYTMKKSRTSQPTVEMLLFEDALDLFTSQTRRFKNGVYTGTDYSFAWRRKDDDNYRLSGTYHQKEGLPADDNAFHFARAAESAWTSYLLPFINRDFRAAGYVEFPLGGKMKKIRVGKGYLEFTPKTGDVRKTAVADMKDITLYGGEFRFSHQDAKWWSGTGKYGFSYGNIPNARLFLLCLDQLAGVQFS